MMTTVDCEVHHENRANEGGVIVSAPGGFTVRANGNYDGIGSDDFEASVVFEGTFAHVHHQEQSRQV